MQRWRVTSWNVRGSRRPDLGEIARRLRALDPDVVALQEVRAHQAARLAALLGWNQVWARKHHPYTPLMWWAAEGLAILARHPLGGRHAASLTPGRSTWTYRHRVVLDATVSPAGAAPLRVVDVHLSPHDRPGDAGARTTESRRVAAALASGATAVPTVVAGDLNGEGERDVLGPLEAAGVADAWARAATQGPGHTSPALRPRRRIDYVLVPLDATDITAEVPEGGPGWSSLSDHLPVTVTFSLPGTGAAAGPAVTPARSSAAAPSP